MFGDKGQGQGQGCQKVIMCQMFPSRLSMGMTDSREEAVTKLKWIGCGGMRLGRECWPGLGLSRGQ